MTSWKMFAGVLLAVAGIVVLSAWWFHAGLALTVAGIYVACLDWRNASQRWKTVFFHGFAQTLLNVSLILWLLAWSTGVDSARPSNGILVDFSALYVGAELGLREPHLLYDLDEQYSREVRHTGLDMEREDFLPYPYPPVLALLLAPLAVLSYETAYKVWLGLNLVVLCWSVFFLAWSLRLDRPRTQFLALFASMTLPVYVTLLQGQTSILVLVLLVLFFADFLGDEEDRPRAGLWAGLLFMKPPQILVPFLLLFLKGRWRGLAIAGSTCSLLLLVSTLTVGLSGMKSFVALLRGMTTGQHEAVVSQAMLNVRGAFSYLALPDWTWVSVSVLAAGVLAWVYVRSPEPLWGGAAAVCIALFAIPHLYMHDFVIGIIGVALVLAASPGGLSVRARLALYGIAWVPAIGLSVWRLTGEVVPWAAITMAALVAYCVWKALPVKRLSRL